MTESNTVPGIYRTRHLLDHGYCRLVESWGSDERIIESARMSTGKSFLGWEPGPCPTCEGSGRAPLQDFTPDFVPQTCHDCGGKGAIPGDKNLLRRLWTLKHSTPFEFAGLTVEIQAPIFVFREWHRHRTQSYSEQSARYVEMPELFYVPSVERLRAGGQSTTNKQSSGGPLSPEAIENARIRIAGAGRRAFAEYRAMLEDGVAKELARSVLPVGTYSRMRATTDLRNWLAFLTLRTAPGAQYETRMYADEVSKIVQELFPRTWALWAEVDP